MHIRQSNCVPYNVYEEVSRRAAYTSIAVIYATSLRRIQSLKLGVFGIVSTSCDKFIVGT
jgi:hypothetical protein